MSCRAPQHRRDPYQPTDRVRDDLHIQPVTLVLARIEAAVVVAGHADPIDTQQRAVEDHERLAGRDRDRLLQGRGHRRQQLERLAHVPVHRRGPDPEPAGQIRIGLALA